MTKSKQYALITPFNLFPDGDAKTRVIGLGLAKYAETGGLAVFLILEPGGGLQMSVDLPQHVGQLDLENEFFLKNWGGSDRAAHVCVQEHLFLLACKQAVQAGDRYVAMSRLDHDMLREMTPEEIEKYTP